MRRVWCLGEPSTIEQLRRRECEFVCNIVTGFCECQTSVVSNWDVIDRLDSYSDRSRRRLKNLQFLRAIDEQIPAEVFDGVGERNVTKAVSRWHQFHITRYEIDSHTATQRIGIPVSRYRCHNDPQIVIVRFRWINIFISRGSTSSQIIVDQERAGDRQWCVLGWHRHDTACEELLPGSGVNISRWIKITNIHTNFIIIRNGYIVLWKNGDFCRRKRSSFALPINEAVIDQIDRDSIILSNERDFIQIVRVPSDRGSVITIQVSITDIIHLNECAGMIKQRNGLTTISRERSPCCDSRFPNDNLCGISRINRGSDAPSLLYEGNIHGPH